MIELLTLIKKKLYSNTVVFFFFFCVCRTVFPKSIHMSLQIQELEKMNEDHVQKRSKKACTNTCENGPPLLNEDD